MVSLIGWGHSVVERGEGRGRGDRGGGERERDCLQTSQLHCGRERGEGRGWERVRGVGVPADQPAAGDGQFNRLGSHCGREREKGEGVGERGGGGSRGFCRPASCYGWLVWQARVAVW